MGMRIDLTDKEKYQVKPKNPEDDEAMTEQMLQDLKQKLLAARDKYILSSQDTLP